MSDIDVSAPKKFQADSTMVEMDSLKDRIALDKYNKSNAALEGGLPILVKKIKSDVVL